MLSLPPTLLSAAMVAVIAVAYLALRKVIDWEDVKGVSWGTFLIGAGLSLGDALGRSGAADWLATLIGPLVTGPPLSGQSAGAGAGVGDLHQFDEQHDDSRNCRRR